MWGQSAQDDSVVTTHYQVVIGGKALQYIARAGLIPLRDDDTGDVYAKLFFIAYTLDRPAAWPPRPMTFLRNGGLCVLVGWARATKRR
jgi:carboxypeptidase C (cathepsin A)